MSLYEARESLSPLEKITQQLEFFTEPKNLIALKLICAKKASERFTLNRTSSTKMESAELEFKWRGEIYRISQWANKLNQLAQILLSRGINSETFDLDYTSVVQAAKFLERNGENWVTTIDQHPEITVDQFVAEIDEKINNALRAKIK